MVVNREFYRNGADYRQGASVSFVDIRRQFDFRSIEIGRWVTAAERDRAANSFYDALCDLQTILTAPELLISLRGTLSLAYGTGGQPGVSAHYIPAQRTFALAKNAGPGSIAHEWFHALDHYLATKAFAGSGGNLGRPQFASRLWLEDTAAPIVHPINDLLFRCYQAILLDEDGETPSPLFLDSVKMDRKLGALYYSQPEEVSARAFEAFVQDSPLKNHYLVKGTLQSTEAQAGLYPQGEQRVRINHAFASYFSALGAVLHNQHQAIS